VSFPIVLLSFISVRVQRAHDKLKSSGGPFPLRWRGSEIWYGLCRTRRLGKRRQAGFMPPTHRCRSSSSGEAGRWRDTFHRVPSVSRVPIRWEFPRNETKTPKIFAVGLGVLGVHASPPNAWCSVPAGSGRNPTHHRLRPWKDGFHAVPIGNKCVGLIRRIRWRETGRFLSGGLRQARFPHSGLARG